MSRKITASQVNKLASTLDQIAEFFERRASEVGIPASVGTDFAYRCDLLSDALEKKASANMTLTEGRRFNPADIGQRTTGPLRRDDEDSYLNNEWSGEEYSSLSDMIQHGHNFHDVSFLNDGEDEEEDCFAVEQDALSKMAFDLFASDDEDEEDEEDEDEEDEEDEDEEDEEDEEDDDEDDEDDEDEDEDDEDEKTQKKARLILAALNLMASEDDDEDDEDDDDEDDEDDDDDREAEETSAKSAGKHLSSAHRRKLSQSAKRAANKPRKKRTTAERNEANKARKRSRARGANV